MYSGMRGTSVTARGEPTGMGCEWRATTSRCAIEQPADGSGEPSDGRFPMSSVRVAVIQAAPVVFDVPRTLARLHELAHAAARQGARLAVFPEAFVSAYPKGMDFGARLGMRTAEGREDFRRYFAGAIDVPGP